jgi:flagellar hook-length control protein FliK
MMVFNPVYMQKAGDSEAQLFGGSFPNQKPTYLFSDIIKVILAKTEQTESGESVNTADSTSNSNPLLISDSEVELFDKLMKLGITGSVSSDSTEANSLSESTVYENLKMFLNGLTNQDEFASSEDKEFEIDKSDLLVVLNIFAGNISEQNNSGNSDVDSSVEISDFIEEVNGLLEGMGKNSNQQVVIQQSDFTLQLEPSTNGKVSVKITAPSTGEIQNRIVEKTDESTSTSLLSSVEKSISNNSVNVDYSYIQNTSSELSDVFVDMNKPVELSDEDRTIISATKTKWEQILNQSKLASTESVPENLIKTDITDTDKEIKNVSAEFQTTADGNKIVENNIDTQDLSNNNKSSKSQTTAAVVDENSVNAKEFFGDKIEVTVVNKEENTVKNIEQPKISSNTQQKTQASDSVPEQNSPNKIAEQSGIKPDLDTMELKLKENLIKDNIQSQIGTKNSEALTDSQQKTILVQNTGTTVKNESVAQIKNDTTTVNSEILESDNIQEAAIKTGDVKVAEDQSFNKEFTTNDQLQKQELAKSVKQKNQKIEVDAQLKNNTSGKSVETDLTIGQNESKQVEMSAVVDGKTSSEKVEQKNQDSEKVISDISKTAKTVSSSQESSSQKSDKQNQNTFEKAFITVNKTEQFSKEVKETAKVVDQSRLMNEIENVIKSGDKKNVTLKIYPEELGSVKISLDFTDNNVSAKINVSNDSVRQVILTQADNLKSSLSESGIQLAALNVSVDNSDEKANPQTKTKKKSANSDDKKVVIKDIPNPVKIKNLGYNTYDYVV